MGVWYGMVKYSRYGYGMVVSSNVSNRVWCATLGEGLDKWGYGLLARVYNEMMGPQHTMMSFKYLKALLLCRKYKI